METVAWVGVVGLLTGILLLLLNLDARINLAGWILFFLGVGGLSIQNLPAGMAAIKVIAGSAAGLLVYLSGILQPGGDDSPVPATNGRAFRVLVSTFILLAAATQSETLIEWFPGANLPVIIGGVLGFGAGLVMISLLSGSQGLILGIFMLLGGFEILFASIEDSVLVTGLLAVVQLSLALGATILSGERGVSAG